MGKFLIKKEDLFHQDHKFIAHGCNCFNIMGAGVAKIVKQKYPEAYAADTKFSKEYSKLSKLGWYSKGVSRDKVIYNLYTQYNTGANFEMLALYLALQTLDDENFECSEENTSCLTKYDTLYIPAIGCGIGGASPQDLIDCLKQAWYEYDVVVCLPDEKVYNQFEKILKNE